MLRDAQLVGRRLHAVRRRVLVAEVVDAVQDAVRRRRPPVDEPRHARHLVAAAVALRAAAVALLRARASRELGGVVGERLQQPKRRVAGADLEDAPRFGKSRERIEQRRHVLAAHVLRVQRPRDAQEARVEAAARRAHRPLGERERDDFVAVVARDAELREQLLEPGGSERRELRCALELVLGKRRLVRQNLLAALEEQVVHRARRHRVRHRRLCLRKVLGELPLKLGRERFQPASALRARPLGNVAPAHGIRHLGPRNHKQQRRAGNAPRHGLHTEFLGHESYCSLSSTVAALTRKVAYCTL